MYLPQWFAFVALLVVVQSTSPEDESYNCEVEYEKVGCYRDRPGDRALAKLILNVRYEIKWKPGEWERYLRRLACRCAKITRVLGQSHFGLQFYGECWSDERAYERFDRHGNSSHQGCVGFQYKNCNDEDGNECVGGPNRNYVYRIAEGGGSGSGHDV
ncbi:PREDICTED: uncharacterized protein LOC107335590 [Acropora digitifera]|uniref:uncharacterized protein LOC107335590 n=1 Tax=Acropora digitifera TaxID=70779 RepID=UPI00077A37D5|nr:PREDICTED: uncharacterized protein LOC107335590 [Acropora digitifera]